MNSIVGFTIYSGLAKNRIKGLKTAQERPLAYFENLERRSLAQGETYLELWGRKGMNERIHTLPDGSLVVVIGSPHGKVDLKDVQDALLADNFELPWDGRVVLLRISPDGKRWTMWNDWLGSIPVFHAQIGQGRIVSTLEPATVAAAGYTSDDFFLPGLVSLLVNGHFISDWTLYKGMKIIPPDSIMEWDEAGFRSRRLWTIEPGQDRWESGWDDLVDEMHDLTHKAIADVLKSESHWILPLSSGLDSRLIAAVGASLGVNFSAYVWGEPETTDVIYSRKIARALGIPWKRINLEKDYLTFYTPLWADLFGSSMHFHGMYQMSFLNGLGDVLGDSLVTGFIGDVLSGSSIMEVGSGAKIYRKDWYMHWGIEEIRNVLKVPVDDAFQEIAAEVQKQAALLRGGRFSRSIQFELWNRQRLFTSFQSTLSGYWRAIRNPYHNRAYARFCLSIPRAVLEGRRLMADVFRRYYGKLAVIPGTYADQPYILTGTYLLKRRITKSLPATLQYGPFAGFDDVPLRMDISCIQASGKEAMWPLSDAWNQLSEWLDVKLLEKEYQAVMRCKDDIRPLRKLQSVQTLAYRLLKS